MMESIKDKYSDSDKLYQQKTRFIQYVYNKLTAGMSKEKIKQENFEAKKMMLKTKSLQCDRYHELIKSFKKTNRVRPAISVVRGQPNNPPTTLQNQSQCLVTSTQTKEDQFASTSARKLVCDYVNLESVDDWSSDEECTDDQYHIKEQVLALRQKQRNEWQNDINKMIIDEYVESTKNDGAPANRLEKITAICNEMYVKSMDAYINKYNRPYIGKMENWVLSYTLWSRFEMILLAKGIAKYGRNYDKIAKLIRTKDELDVYLTYEYQNSFFDHMSKIDDYYHYPILKSYIENEGFFIYKAHKGLSSLELANTKATALSIVQMIDSLSLNKAESKENIQVTQSTDDYPNAHTNEGRDTQVISCGMDVLSELPPQQQSSSQSLSIINDRLLHAEPLNQHEQLGQLLPQQQLPSPSLSPINDHHLHAEFTLYNQQQQQYLTIGVPHILNSELVPDATGQLPFGNVVQPLNGVDNGEVDDFVEKLANNEIDETDVNKQIAIDQSWNPPFAPISNIELPNPNDDAENDLNKKSNQPPTGSGTISWHPIGHPAVDIGNTRKMAVEAFLSTFNRRNCKPPRLATKCSHPGCKYATTISTSLKNHKRTHLGIKPYKCKWPLCVYSSTHKSNTITHINAMHLNKETNQTQLGKAKDYVEVLHELL